MVGTKIIAIFAHSVASANGKGNTIYAIGSTITACSK